MYWRCATSSRRYEIPMHHNAATPNRACRACENPSCRSHPWDLHSWTTSLVIFRDGSGDGTNETGMATQPNTTVQRAGAERPIDCLIASLLQADPPQIRFDTYSLLLEMPEPPARLEISDRVLHCIADRAHLHPEKLFRLLVGEEEVLWTPFGNLCVDPLEPTK